MRTHYPRTAHLPWSPGASADDVRAGDVSGFAGREVVVTEKLDGENTTLYADGMHARSLDSAHHPSRAWVKGLQARVGSSIPDGWRVCGENLFARHSLAYQELESYFYGFSVWDGDWCLDWDSTVRLLRRTGIPAPRVLWRGVFDERAIRALRWDSARQEGYVVRTVAGFSREDFGVRVAKFVRPGHVQTDTHWMHAEVVANGLGPGAALWDVRSGGVVDGADLLAAVGLERVGVAGAEGVAAEVSTGLDVLGRTGDARLAGVLAALLARTHRGRLTPGLVPALGMPLARRVADLVGLHERLHRELPDDERRAGLVRMAAAADLGVLHAVSLAVAPSPEAKGNVEWSALFAEDSGLLGEDALEPLRSGLRAALLAADVGPDAIDRCWGQAREAFADGRISSVSSVEEAVAATWRWRDGAYPRLIHLVGPSGSGKSSFVATLPGIDAHVSQDDLRAARGSRGDQRANSDVLREALGLLDAALADGGTAVWDATSLTGQQRSLVRGVARGRDALTTQAVLYVGEDEVFRRNAARVHRVPDEALKAQLGRFAPPYAGQAHRTWYVGAAGSVEDVDDAAHGLYGLHGLNGLEG